MQSRPLTRPRTSRRQTARAGPGARRAVRFRIRRLRGRIPQHSFAVRPLGGVRAMRRTPARSPCSPTRRTDRLAWTARRRSIPGPLRDPRNLRNRGRDPHDRALEIWAPTAPLPTTPGLMRPRHRCRTFPPSCLL